MRLAKLLWICCAVLCVAPAFAQTEDCATATPVGEGSFPFDTTGTALDGPADCDGNMGNDVWFLYTATVTGNVSINTCGSPGSLTDTVICVYDGAAACPIAGDVGIGSDDDTCAAGGGGSAFNSEVVVSVTAGDSFYVQVGGWNGAEGDSALNIGVLEVCDNGVDDDGDGDTDCADSECVGEAACLEAGNCGDGIDNDLDGLTDCDDDDCDSDGLCTELDCDDGVDNDGDGFTDCDDVDCDASPACAVSFADECVDATFAIGEGTFPYDNTGATSNGPSNCDTNMSTDLWFLYTATAGGLATIDTCSDGTLGDTTLCVYDAALGCPLDGDAGLANDDDSCAPPSGGSAFLSSVDLVVAAGDSFYIQVGGWNGSEGSGALNITLGPPANDNCADAQNVGEGLFPYTTAMSTLDGPNDADTNMGNDVWFLYTASETGTAIISTCEDGSLGDTVLIIYDGAACPDPLGTGAALAADDDVCSPPSGGSAFLAEITVPVTAGDSFYVQVGGFNGAEGNGALSIEVLAPPANDNCVDAIAIGDGATEFDNVLASLDGAGGATNECDANMDTDVWFLYTACADGDVTVDTCATIGSLTDTVLCVYDAAAGCPLAGDVGIASNDDEAGCGPSGFNSTATFTAVAGSEYYIQVGGWNGAEGEGTLTVTPGALPGDTADTAVAIGEGSFDFDNSCAASDGPTDCDTNMTTDLWFLYTATITGDATITTCNTVGTLTDTVLCVYDGAALPVSGDIGIASNDDECGTTGFNSEVIIPVTAGTSYYVQVGGWNGTTGDATLDISVELPCVDPTPSFTADPVSGIAPLTVDFTNTSDDGGDAATTYSWDFGDGNGSTDVDPSNSYADCGTYDVTLTADGCGATISVTETGLIQVFAMGDVNGDCLVDVADPQALANFLFGGGTAPVCGNAANVNGDGATDLGDVVYLLNFLFSGGAALVPNGPGC
ncbi:MAG: PKD domain-containing protein [Planctomycetota bacterium]